MRIIRFALLLTACLLSAPSPAQSNILMTNNAADQVLRGNYNPATYMATNVINHPTTLSSRIQMEVSADSLFAHLKKLTGFGTRNTGSDTLSATWGIGAARRWAHDKFMQISNDNENRLLVGYLQFDRMICGMTQHRNVVGVLPGMDASADGYILIEGHMDSRCNSNCDINCNAQGADDNGSGSALVIELARVLSQFSFDHTVVFMLTTAEEQGLYGAEAMAEFCNQENIPIKAVLNNDVIGGIICGNTASPPGCPGAGDIDSLNVRMFSQGGYNSPHKQLARFIKLEYQEELRPLVDVPMSLNVMSAEDRSGRGGDHIPFRQNGFKAMRFTSANEHGNGSAGGGYIDHQHTSADSIGVDLDNNGSIDSFWVDFNYLARNARINGNAAAMIGIGPETPDFSATAANGGAEVTILTQLQYGIYRVGVRTVTNDWDSVYTINGPIDTIYGLPTATAIILSVASVDSNGIESLFSFETNIVIAGVNGELPPPGPKLLQNRPNPFDEQTIITVQLDEHLDFEEAFIRISDMEGKEVERIPITLEAPMNEVLFNHGFHASGIYFYSLVIDGKLMETRKMIMQE